MDILIECTPRKVVLKRSINDEEAHKIIDAKKSAPFRTLLSSPKKSEIHTHSVKTTYEATTMLAGRYSARYYRHAEHTIRVDHNVQRVEVGGGVFNVKSRSGIKRAVYGPRSRRDVVLRLEEYVHDDSEGEIFIDHHGGEVAKFAHRPKSAALESYPDRVLKAADIVRDSELTQDALVGRLCKKLVPVSKQDDIRDLHDQATIKKIIEIYVPVIEARLVGPKRRIRILRIDAVSKKVLKA